MRRGVFIISLCFLLLFGGLGALYFGPRTILHPGPFAAGGIPYIHLNRLIGIILFFLAGICGTLGTLMLRTASARLTRGLQRMRSSGLLDEVSSPHPDLDVLVDAVNAIVRQSEEAVAQARLSVRELEIRLKVATAERQHAEAIIYSISDAVLVTDPFDEVVLANESAARAFQFDLSTANRSPVEKVLADPKMIALIREMRQSESRGARRIVELAHHEPAGDKVYKVTLSCVEAPGDKSAGVVAVLHDMTQEKEVARMKSDFVSHVSHELRTPLASIKAYAEMLIDGEAGSEKDRKDFYEVIHNEANRLGRLIDNILNISRIESGLVKVNKKPQSLTVILKEAVEVIAPQARQKGITVQEQLPPAFYQTMVDRDMLYEAILNLLGNAVKYTPENGVIRVETAADEGRKKVVARISDTGVGIPPKDLPFIFDKFYRVEVNNRMAKGTGLGLSLVKHIVENVHQGRLFVESETGKGSTFGFELDMV